MSAREAGCVYCGLPRAGVRDKSRRVVPLPACVAHADLLALDPAYDLGLGLAARSYPALDLERAPSALRREASPSGHPGSPASSSSPASASSAASVGTATLALAVGAPRDGPTAAA